MSNTVALGRTGLVLNRNGFGALPIQRVGFDEAALLLHRALDGGVNFIDTARAYSDSEEKIGRALHAQRRRFTLATKTMAADAAGFWHDLDVSLRLLQTDHIDVYQFHNPGFCPKPGDGSGLYEAMLEARAQGKIRWIGITNHRAHILTEAVESGLYDTVQYPFCYLATERDTALVRLCAEKNIGFIAMKSLSGGLITRSDAAYAFAAQHPNVLPIWGVQRVSELDEFLAYDAAPPAMSDEIRALIDRDRAELAGEFCRGCGYCMPCPQGIEINNCNRMSLMLRRAPSNAWTTPEWVEKMNRIDDCLACGRCMTHCPYQLDIPRLLKKNLADFRAFVRS